MSATGLAASSFQHPLFSQAQLTASSAHTFSIFILLTTRLQPRLHVLAGMGWDELKLPNAVRPDDEFDSNDGSGDA